MYTVGVQNSQLDSEVTVNYDLVILDIFIFLNLNRLMDISK